MEISYTDYLTHANILNFDEMHKIHSCMLIALKNLYDDYAKELYNDFVSSCIKYASYRQNWLISKNRYVENDNRTMSHDKLIAMINQLCNYMKMQNGDTEWRNWIGDERKTIGDFACYIAFIYGIESR